MATYETGADCPLLMMAGKTETECRGANCAWWIGDCCAVAEIPISIACFQDAMEARV